MKALKLRQEKREIQINKRQIEEEIKRKKYKMMSNLDRLMKSPSSFSPEKIKQIFPDDKDVIEKFNFLNSASNDVENRLHSEPKHRHLDDKYGSMNSSRSEKDYFFN